MKGSTVIYAGAGLAALYLLLQSQTAVAQSAITSSTAAGTNAASNSNSMLGALSSLLKGSSSGSGSKGSSGGGSGGGFGGGSSSGGGNSGSGANSDTLDGETATDAYDNWVTSLGVNSNLPVDTSTTDNNYIDQVSTPTYDPPALTDFPDLNSGTAGAGTSALYDDDNDDDYSEE